MRIVLEQLGAPWPTLAAVVLSAAAVYVAVIVLTRLAGVRSLAKMWLDEELLDGVRLTSA